MKAVKVDFNRLLGFKLIVRAHRAMQGVEAEACAATCESETLVDSTAILQARIGNKPTPGLRYRRA